MKLAVGLLGATSIVLFFVAPKLAWVWLLAPIPVLYVVVIAQGLVEGPSGPQFLGDYASGGMIANTVGFIWAGVTHRVSPLAAALAATLVGGVIALLAPPYGPSRIASRLGSVLKRYGTALSSLGKETKGATHPIDPIGCAVALGLGLVFAVLLLVGGTIVELAIVPAGLLVFGTVLTVLRTMLEGSRCGSRSLRAVPSVALGIQSGILVAIVIALVRK